MTDAEAPARAHGKNAFFFVVVTVFIDMMGFSIIMPVLPSLLSEITETSVEDAIVWGGALTATYALMSFAAGPTLGSLSDRFGRRPILLASLAALAIDYVIMGFATSLAVLFIGRALAGVCAATFSTANAYIADVTEPAERGRAFGTLGAAFGLGFILGPAIGGLLGEIDTRAPFFAAAALAAANFLYGWFVLPESLKPENRRSFDPARANPFGAFRHFSKLPKVVWFLAAVGIYALAHSIYPATWNFHGAIRYDWSEAEIGVSLAVVGLSAAVVQAALIGPIIKRFGVYRVAVWSFIVNVAALTAYAFAFAPWMVFAIIPLGAFGGLTGPAMTTIMTNLTPADSQGELQGANASLNALAMIISPVLLTQTLHAFSTESAPVYFPGAAFLLAALLTLAAMIPLFAGLRANKAEIALARGDTAASTETAAS
ncbi:MAG: TCR/Tet family MFS transporter [Pseudomonadota bacterium]